MSDLSSARLRFIGQAELQSSWASLAGAVLHISRIAESQCRALTSADIVLMQDYAVRCRAIYKSIDTDARAMR